MDALSLFLGRILVVVAAISALFFTLAAIMLLVAVLVSGDIAVCSFSGEGSYGQRCVELHDDNE